MGTPTYSYVSIVIITKATDEDSIIYETSVMKMFMVPLLLKLVKVRFVSFSKTVNITCKNKNLLEKENFMNNFSSIIYAVGEPYSIKQPSWQFHRCKQKIVIVI